MTLPASSSVGLAPDIGSEVEDRWKCPQTHAEIRSCPHGPRHWQG